MHGGDRMATSARGTLAWSAQQINVCSMTQSQSIVRQKDRATLVCAMSRLQCDLQACGGVEEPEQQASI